MPSPQTDWQMEGEPLQVKPAFRVQKGEQPSSSMRFWSSHSSGGSVRALPQREEGVFAAESQSEKEASENAAEEKFGTGERMMHRQVPSQTCPNEQGMPTSHCSPFWGMASPQRGGGEEEAWATNVTEEALLISAWMGRHWQVDVQ